MYVLFVTSHPVFLHFWIRKPIFENLKIHAKQPTLKLNSVWEADRIRKKSFWNCKKKEVYLQRAISFWKKRTWTKKAGWRLLPNSLQYVCTAHCRFDGFDRKESHIVESCYFCLSFFTEQCIATIFIWELTILHLCGELALFKMSGQMLRVLPQLSPLESSLPYLRAF